MSESCNRLKYLWILWKLLLIMGYNWLLIVFTYLNIFVALANKRLEFQFPGNLCSLLLPQFAFKKTSAFICPSNKIQFLNLTICSLIQQ